MSVMNNDVNSVAWAYCTLMSFPVIDKLSTTAIYLV